INIDAVETLGDGRRNQARSHLLHCIFRHYPRPKPVALETDFQGYIEEQRLYFAAVGLADANVRRALLRSEIGGVDIGQGAAECEALAKQVAQSLENLVMEGLVGLVIRQQAADGVR